MDAEPKLEVAKDKPLRYCAFCGKSEKALSVLIVSDNSSICDGCVLTCIEVIFRKGDDRKQKLDRVLVAMSDEVGESKGEAA